MTIPPVLENMLPKHLVDQYAALYERNIARDMEERRIMEQQASIYHTATGWSLFVITGGKP